MFSNFFSRLGNFLQFATAGALLAASFLIQREIINACLSRPWLASVIAVLLVVSRVLAVSYRHSHLTSFFLANTLLAPFRFGLWSLALLYAVSFFAVHLEPFGSEALAALIDFYYLPLMPMEWRFALALLLAVLLELGLAVLLGQLARAYAPLLRAQQDYRLQRELRLVQAKNELRLVRDVDQTLREQMAVEFEHIEQRLQQAAAEATAGKLAGSAIKPDS